jgi:hypothetical protein
MGIKCATLEILIAGLVKIAVISDMPPCALYIVTDLLDHESRKQDLPKDR